MSNVPVRPSALDDSARWHPHTNEWRSAPVDAEGQSHGLVRGFRPDGSLCWEQSYVRGVLDGPFRRYHPNGELARSGQFRAGELDGELVAFASRDATAERLRSCCVPPGAWSLRARYQQGRLEQEVFFDRDGRRLLPDGSIHPDLPAGVPAEARFTPELGRQWVLGAYQGGQRQGSWRFWSEAGEPLVDAEYAAGQAVGHWVLHQPGLARKLGSELRDLQACAVFANERHSADHFHALARDLLAQARPAEALCALARARDPELSARLAELTLARPPAEAQRVLLELGSQASLERTANALLLGATPSGVLQRLARLLPGRELVAEDLLDAALLLDPERRELYGSRASVRIQRGDVNGALADIARLEPDSATRRFLTQYVQVLFWPFEVWSNREPLGESEPEELPDQVLQPVSAVVSTIRKCALRVTLVRDALSARGLELAGWFPPDLCELYAGVEVQLGVWEFDLDEDGESVRIRVDETMDLDGLDVPALLRRARSDFAALCWICWGAGLDHAGVPAALRPRPEFRRALASAVLRYWHCQDRLQTSGLRARMQGAPSFSWHGVPIGEMAAPIAELAADAYREMRAALFWLADPDCQSLWQDDLRPA